MCPGRGAPMKLDAGKDFLACEYCGAAHFPDRYPDGVRVLDEASDEQCPRCSVPLVQGSSLRAAGLGRARPPHQVPPVLEGNGYVPLRRSCEKCSLNWLDYGELQHIVRAPDERYVFAIDEDERLNASKEN